jgi:chromosome partitioning protein
MKVISFVNQKGGVAKTTSCVNIGASLADQGKTVLLIDLDAQGSLSTSTGLREIGADELTTYEVLKGADIKEATRTLSEGLSVLPTDIRLSGAEIELSSVPGREFLLREALSEFESVFDYVLIDCPPSLGVLTLIALTASDGVIVPVKADYLALKGMSQLVDVINVVKRRMNPGLEIVGVIATFFNSRRNLDQQIVDQIETFFPGKLFETKISQNTALAEAPSQGKNIFEYDSRSKGAQQYRTLAEELIEREVI